MYELYDWEKFENFTKLYSEDETLWNFTNFTFFCTICRHCTAGHAAPKTFPHYGCTV